MTRKAGILMPITSLPSKHGIGTLGKEAYKFVDWLSMANIKIWQILPINLIIYDNCPYKISSSQALNYYLIDFDNLKKKGLIKKSEYSYLYNKNITNIDYSNIFKEKEKLLRLAFSRFNIDNSDFIQFSTNNEFIDFACFMLLRQINDDKPWYLWPDKYKFYSKALIDELYNAYKEDILFWIWTQYETLLEWFELKLYANSSNVEIISELPLYMEYNSVDVWVHPELFELSSDLSLRLISGCPPCEIFKNGQSWGSPVYQWSKHSESSYGWWHKRIKLGLKLFNEIIIDHFRGFFSFYAIDHFENGNWYNAPGVELLKAIDSNRIIADDLYCHDELAIDSINSLGFKSIRMLEGEFEGLKEGSSFPSVIKNNCALYLSRQDNKPFMEYLEDLNKNEFSNFKRNLKNECLKLNIDYNFFSTSLKYYTDKIIELGLASNAEYFIIPIQDIFHKGREGRMNTPLTISNVNWSYRAKDKDFSIDRAGWLKELILKYSR